MTLEEKAKEWVKDNCCDLCVCRDECEIGCIHCGAIDGYLAGAKEGSQLDEVWHDYDAGEDCYEDSHEGRWIRRETSRPQWQYLKDGKFPENYRRVLITVLDDEGKRVVVSGMFVTKIINRNKKTKKIWYWLYDSDDVFVTSGSPGECSKPIAWKPFPGPAEATK